MAKALKEWIASDVRRARKLSPRVLSEQYFFRDPLRPVFADSSYFFAPADGVILYQRELAPTEKLVEIKGRVYSLTEALRDDSFDQTCLVIGIFMTLYDPHINRVPFSGTLSYDLLPTIETHNWPMLATEEDLLRGHLAVLDDADYLFNNQRMLNRVYASGLGLTYYMLQIADYDVTAILPFETRQNRHYAQNQRFSQVRFGSQLDLIIPLSPRWKFETLLPDETHIEAGLDPLVRIIQQSEYDR